MLAIMAISLGHLSRSAYGTWPGLLIPAFVVPVGLIFPLLVKRWGGTRAAETASIFVLVGGFVLRSAVVGMPFPLLSLTTVGR
jgi:formate-dependent nitrite reductase membrane component NrfD